MSDACQLSAALRLPVAQSFFDQEVSVGQAVLFALIALVVLAVLIQSRLSAQMNEQMKQWESARLTQEKASIEASVRREKDLELAAIEKDSADSIRAAQRDAALALRQWKADYAGSIRADAIARSRAVITGKVTEHMAPYLPGFPFNPKDARFIGSPVDFLVFDGLDEGDLKEIIFVEMKTQSSRLTTRQKQIREVIALGSVSWQEIRHSEEASDAILPADLFEGIYEAGSILDEDEESQEELLD